MMESIRNYIIRELAARMCPLTLGGLSKIINGDRSAHFSTAKELAHITRTKPDMWQDKAMKEERQQALARLAVRKKMGFFVGRGRPRKGE
jgi:hypothetical protein